MSKLRPFTHRIYVDFSGDDGDPRTPGASRCICIAWVASTENDLYHNEGIVLQIKKVIGCRASNNLRYKSLRRHRLKKDALDLLTQLKVSAVVVPVLKERIADQELKNPRTKKLVDLIHYFPLSRLLDRITQACPDIYFQLIFDQVGWRGCEADIEKSFRQDPELDWGKARPDWLLFAKSGNSLMLQLADIIAGLTREYVESLQTQKLPNCVVCAVKGKPERPCPYKLGKRSLPNHNLIEVVYPLLVKKDELAWEQGFVVRPPAVCREYKFVDCLFGQ
jgi:hypothetical protein